MRTSILASVAYLFLFAVAPATQVRAADGPGSDSAAEAAYTKALEKRADDVLDVLKLDDKAKADRVRDVIIAEYRGLRALQDIRDERIKLLRGREELAKPDLDSRIKAERELTVASCASLNEKFLAKLAEDLSPEQVDQVKDKMTYNKLQVTFDGYVKMLPDLTADQKKAVREMLTRARDEAVYAGSSEEKSEVFNKYKGRANNYLSSQGYDLKRASKEWSDRLKAEKTAKSGEPR
jgi:Spy/CpxP family protein refolding chaperone